MKKAVRLKASQTTGQICHNRREWNLAPVTYQLSASIAITQEEASGPVLSSGTAGPL